MLRSLCWIGLTEDWPWDKWGLTLLPGVWLHMTIDQHREAVASHNLVARYLEEHPLEIDQLFNEKGEVKYFSVLDRAEIAYL